MDEISKIIYRAEHGCMHPQDQLVIWAALRTIATDLKEIEQAVANGLNHVRQIKANHHED